MPMDDKALLDLIWRLHFPTELQQHLAGLGDWRLFPLRSLVLYFDDDGHCIGAPETVAAALGRLLIDCHLVNYLDAMEWACAFAVNLTTSKLKREKPTKENNQ